MSAGAGQEPSILASKVGKRYLKFDDEAQLATRRARLLSRTRRTHHWALRDVNLEVQPGETLGIIGRNGSGKSTLLRMLAGVTAPTEGRVIVRGRVAPLIAVGVGFHPELTGRENVYVNGSILGVPRRTIDARFDAIVDFAGIENFIDTPVKFYSSGMFVRLGFGVSMFADPDVLLVDEVLAVGDFAFQLKCFDQMETARQNGTAIIVVSHALSAIRRLCDQTMLLDEGTVRYTGDTVEAIANFHEVLGEAREIEASEGRGQSAGPAKPKAEVDSFELTNDAGARTRQFGSGDKAAFTIKVRVLEDLDHPIIFFRTFNPAGLQVYGQTTLGEPTGNFRAGTVMSIVVHIPLDLGGGSYTAEFDMTSADGEACLRPHVPLSFFVTGRPGVLGAAADLHAVIQTSAAEPTQQGAAPSSLSGEPWR